MGYANISSVADGHKKIVYINNKNKIVKVKIMYLPTVSTVRYFSSVILLPTGRQNIYCFLTADPNICEIYFILTAQVHTLPTYLLDFLF
jgi:hypothetical protein